MFNESLESRRLMSVAASVGAGTLFVYGDDNANGISVERVSGGAQVSVKNYVSGSGYVQFYVTSADKVKHIRVFGQGGNDTISVDDILTADVMIAGGAGADYLKSGGTFGVVYGHSFDGAGDDNAGDTLVSGGTGEVNLFGQGGNDKFFFDRSQVGGYGGRDFAYGQAGNDRFYAFRDDRYLHELSGGKGRDTADFSGYDAYETTLVLGGKDSGAISGNPKERNYTIRADVENLVGSPARDHITTIDGLAVDNHIWGMGGQDVIEAGDGNDWIDGGNDAGDVIWERGLHSGNDTIYGGEGNDQIVAGNGNDLVYGGKGRDSIDGGGGNDKLYGQSGDDTVIGGDGIDWLVGGSGDDLLRSDDNEGPDLVFGGNTDGLNNGIDRARIDQHNGVLNDFVFSVDNII